MAALIVKAATRPFLHRRGCAFVQVDDLGQLQEKPAYRTRIEFYTGLALFGGKAAARLRGVRAA